MASHNKEQIDFAISKIEKARKVIGFGEPEEVLVERIAVNK